MELLRDVLRTGDASGRMRRRWLLFPISVAVHATAAVAYLIIPLAAAVELPPAAPPNSSRHWVMPIATPHETPAVVRKAVVAPNAAPAEAPPRLAPEVSTGPNLPSPEGAIAGPPGVSVGVPDALSDVGTTLPPAPPPIVAAKPPGPVRIGGDVRAPQRLVATPPVYPPVAIAAHIEGRVVLEALIDEQGRVDQVKVLRSVALLDAAAMDAVRSWRYTPTTLNGVPVAVLMTVTVTFTLQR
jgi:protein TonB